MISRQQAIDLLESNDLIAIALEADTLRKRLHPEPIVTYCLDSENGSSPSVIAPVPFSASDTADQHVDRLETIRHMQETRGDLAAVFPYFNGTAAEYLKLVAISRIYLDNVSHIQTSWTQGLKICQIALRFGADDMSAALSGESGRPVPEEEIRCLIRDAGFIPKQRDALFRTYFLR